MLSEEPRGCLLSAQFARVLDYRAFLSLLTRQRVEPMHLAFVCPKCGAVQSAYTWRFVSTEPLAPSTLDAVTGYKCVGNIAARNAQEIPGLRECDGDARTLPSSGLWAITTPLGTTYKMFPAASPELAQALKQRFAGLLEDRERLLKKNGSA